MKKYIPLAALVAEIDNILNIAEEHWDTDYVEGARWFADKLQNAINTLEVKEIGISIPNTNDTLKEEGLDPNSKAKKIFKECYYMLSENLKHRKESKL